MNILDVLFYVYLCKLINRFNYFSFCDPNDRDSDLCWPSASIKITTKRSSDSSDSEEKDNNQYDIEEDGTSITYKIKSTAKCIKIEFGNNLIWEYNSQSAIEEDEYPSKITVKPYTKNIWVNFPNKLHIYTYRNNKWELTLNHSTKPASNETSQDKTYKLDSIGLGFGAKKVKIVNIDATDPSDIKISDISDFEKMMEDQHVVRYKYMVFNRYLELRYNDEVIWRDPTIAKGHKYPKMIYIGVGEQTIYFEFIGFYFILYSSGPDVILFLERCFLGRKVGSIPPDAVYPKINLDITTIDPNDPSCLKLNDDTQYEIKGIEISKAVSMYKFKDGARCVKIVCQGYLIWQYEEDKYQTQYPREIYIDTFAKKTIKIKFRDRYYIYRYLYYEWVFVVLYISGEVKYDNDPPLLIPSKETLEEKEKRRLRERNEEESGNDINSKDRQAEINPKESETV